MNKKYIVGGLIFWAGLSGYMGLRILESYTEDAVFAALSAVPAQAQEIRYSFLNNTLRLKGVEYELPDKKIMHKGTIESVEVTGFNRKCMFVKPNMPAYDPDALPIVAESVTATGIVDNVHVGHTRMEQRVERVELRGWYQRLGMLLDQHNQHSGEASFFEELYRCRLDGLELDKVTSVISEPETVPVTFAAAKAMLSEGIRAPRGTDRVSPVSLRLSGLSISGRNFSGGLQQLDLNGLLLLEPADMAEFLRLNRELDAAVSKNADDDAAETLLDGMFEILAKHGQDRRPLSGLAMQGGSFAVMERLPGGGLGDVVLNMALKSLNCTMGMTPDGEFRDDVTLSGLNVSFPSPGRFRDIFSRYAPDGLTLNGTSSTVAGDDVLSARTRCEMEGLGELEGELDLTGDIRSLRTLALADSPEERLDELMQSVRLRRLNLDYRDSGLVPLAVELMACWGFDTPEETLNNAVALLTMLGQTPERPVREMCRALMEQLVTPGELIVTVAPEQPMNVMEALSLASVDPDALPVTFTSKPGAKALKDYFPGEGK